MDDGGIIERYLAELQFLGRSPGTVRLRGYQLRAWEAWCAGHGLRVEVACRASVVEYLGRFEEPETRASNMSAIRGFCGWLVDTGEAGRDPTRRLPAVQRALGEPNPIPDEVLRGVLTTCGQEDRAMVVLGRFAGLRASEIARAHRRYLRGGPGSETVRLWGKGGRWRELPAHPLVADVLRSCDSWLFPSPVRPRHPIVAGTVTARLADLLPGAWTAHSLRHAFASELYERSLDLRLVQDALGHSDPRTTARYVRVQLDRTAVLSLQLVV